MTITKPTVGGNDGTWGAVLNTALDTLDTQSTSAGTTASAAQAAVNAHTPLIRRPFNKSSFWYVGAASTASQGLVINNGFWVPRYFDKTVTISKAAVKITTAGDATAVIRLGIYADDGAGKPTGTSLGTFATADASTTGTKEVAATTAIALSGPGLYWVYVQPEGVTAPNVTAVSTNLDPIPNTSGNNDPSVVSNCWTVASISSGSLPTAVPASITAVSYRAAAVNLFLSAVS